MKLRRLTLLATLAGLSANQCALGAVDETDDRIAISGSGSTLTHTNGGGGGSLGWLHNLDADLLTAVAAEHQELSVAQWTFGSALASWGTNWDGGHYTIGGEAHEGAGVDGVHAFHYHIEAVDVSATYFHRLTAQLEDRRIDVESTHGNLPKVLVSYVLNPHLLATASFSSSINGNLGTHLGSARMDYYAAKFNLLGGVAYGPASAAVLDLAITVPIHRLKEAYAGIALPFPRARGELTLLADYQDLAGSKRATITVNYIFHVGHRPATP